ncbi:MAG: T9SS type A sorting domain-containing protein [Cytophagaceae bacterium]|nr:T9SS type A sorting domain-containing protein [Cytophagaceae bacterium]
MKKILGRLFVCLSLMILSGKFLNATGLHLNTLPSTLSTCSNHILSWTSANSYPAYVLEYTLDSGSTWVVIKSNHPSTSYVWTPPSVNASLLIRVSVAGSPEISDTSDTYLKLEKLYARILNPDTTVCYGAKITLKADRPSYVLGANWSGSNYLTTLPNGQSIVTIYEQSTLIFTASFGNCMIKDTLRVGVNMQPEPTVEIRMPQQYCPQQSGTFQALVTNFSSPPTYQWYLNGTLQAATSDSYTGLVGLSDTLVVRAIGSTTCPIHAAAKSEALVIQQAVNIEPDFSLSYYATPCADGKTIMTPIIFTYPIGRHVGYNWYVNNVFAGSRLGDFKLTVNTGDVVRYAINYEVYCGNWKYKEHSTTIQLKIPTVNITASHSGTVCAGTSVQFNAVIANFQNPRYEWKINGIVSGSNASTFSTNTLSGNNAITLTVHEQNSYCSDKPVVVSNTLQIQVDPIITPSISIAASPSTSVCEGSNVSFTPTVTQGGTPIIHWYVAGNLVHTGASYSSSTLQQGNSVYAVMNSSLNCSSQATSNSLSMTITPSSTATASITASPSSTICAGQQVTFTATHTNGGNAPQFRWKVNNTIVSSSTSFSSSTLKHSDVVSLVFTSNKQCVLGSPVTSNSIPMTVNPLVTPHLQITPDKGPTVCEGTEVTYTANYSGGGTNPIFQWSLNGAPAGNNAPTFTYTATSSSQYVHVLMTSNNACATFQNIDVVNQYLQVSPKISLGVSMEVSPANNICEGTMVQFNAIPVNENNPVYEWRLNGNVVGTGSSFSSATLQNMDEVVVAMTSSKQCVTSSTVHSDPSIMQVTPVSAAAVSISSGSLPSCLGTNLTFTATPNHILNAPTYQWYVNNMPVAGNSSSITSDTLTQGSFVWVRLTSDKPCVTIPGTSDSIQVSIYPSVGAVTSISGNSTVCRDKSESYQASPAVHALGYSWSLPNGWTGNSTNDIIQTISGASSGIISVTPYNNCGLGTAFTLAVTVEPSPSIVILHEQTICDNASPMKLEASPSGGNFSGAGVENGWLNPATIQPGAHTISYTYTSALSCAYQHDFEVTVSPCSPTQKASDEESLVYVMPNPSTGSFRVNTPSSGFRIQLFDLQGHVLESQKSQGIPVEFINIPPGIYVLQVTDPINGRVHSEKILIQ